MQIGFYQFSPRFGRLEANRERMAKALTEAGAELIVAPELATSGYLFASSEEVERAAEGREGESIRFLQEVVRASGTHLVFGWPERGEDGCYNSAALLYPDGRLAVYRKIHLFSEEKRYFLPGNLGFPLFEVKGVKVGILVCFDHLFPEAARSLALQGAQIVCHPSNLVLPGYGQLTTRVRSLENRVFWVLANRTGSEERGGKSLRYTGCSQITAPGGEILEQADAEEEAIKVVQIDPAQAQDKKVTPWNDLFEDRRPEAYSL